jgi:cell pole-organizing protein PopZ
MGATVAPRQTIQRGIIEMSDTKAQPEPTMEEILASIRRIISENDDQGASAPAAAANQPASDATSDVLELTDMVADDGSVISLNTPFGKDDVNDNLVGDDDDDDEAEDVSDVAADDGDDDDEIPPLPDDQTAEELAEEPEITMEDTQDDKIDFSADEPAGQAKQDGLMSAAAAGATAAAFAALARSSQQSGNGGLALGSGRTLEDLVQEMIRPMIKEWLDKNLPPMAERLVRKELERLSRHAED